MREVRFQAFATTDRSAPNRSQSPFRNVQEDQIVWGRSPVRFDLAGGWTDTPPYCLSYGGKVVNFAADLNGQSPIQVFARISKEPRILLRSLDLGLDEKIETFDELLARDRLGGGFALPGPALSWLVSLLNSMSKVTSAPFAIYWRLQSGEVLN